MNLIEFLNQFPDEQSCKDHFIEQRKKKGVVCKKCQHQEHYWLQNKERFQCKKCKFRTTVRSGTLLHATKLTYRYWYLAIHLMTATKKGFSAHEMKRQLGHKRYYPIWCMMRKIRVAMGSSDDISRLQGMVELDDTYISTYTKEVDRRNLKRGKGSQKKSKVTVMAASFPLEVEGEKQKYCGNFKMQVNTSETKESTNYISQKNIDCDSIIFSDMSTSYNDLDDLFERNVQHKSMQDGESDFSWVHTSIAHVKRFILGIYHLVKEKYLQYYLDEFCYKLNRRNFKSLFESAIYDFV